jgi:precorrin-3B synthase
VDYACPGALQTHHAAVGALARIRLPGGVLTAAQLAALADTSNHLGSWTPRSELSLHCRSCRADSCSASTTAGATCRVWAPTL